jgi:hypothetical protein
MMGRLLYVLCKLCSNGSILLLERICIGIACYPIFGDSKPSTDDNSPVILSNILSRRTFIPSMKLFLLILLIQIRFSRLGRWQKIHENEDTASIPDSAVIQTRSVVQPGSIDSNLCFICKKKSFKRDFKLHKIESSDQWNRVEPPIGSE